MLVPMCYARAYVYVRGTYACVRTLEIVNSCYGYAGYVCYTYGMTLPTTHNDTDAYYVVAEEEYPRVYGPYVDAVQAGTDARRRALLDWRAWSVDYTEMVRRVRHATDAGYPPQFLPPLPPR